MSGSTTDINTGTMIWFGVFVSMILLYNMAWWTMIIWKNLFGKECSDQDIELVPVQFQDGSVAMMNPNDPHDVAAVAAIHREGQGGKTPQDAFYSPNTGGMPAKDINEYDWSKQDYETQTAGPIGEKTYD